jgi:SAM-dependent methyltransferase
MWNERYSAKEYVYGTQPNAFLRENVAAIREGPILSLCEGEGRNAVFLAERGFDVLGVDGSDVGLKKAQELAAARGVKIETLVCDLAQYTPPAQTFGAVVAIFAHVPSAVRRKVFRASVEALKPGGVFLLEAYTPEQLGRNTGGPKELDRLVSLEDLHIDLEGCEFLLGRETEREVVEGCFHTGPGAVVQVIARKRS